MKKKKDVVLKPKMGLLPFFFFLILFGCFIGRLIYLCLVDFKVGESTIQGFIASRNIQEDVVVPTRGTIYDLTGNVLAQDVSSYTVIAYLSETRSENSNEPRHVVDKEGTANALAPLINMEQADVLELLNKSAYQVELGPGGRGLSQIEMEAIKNLNLPGIDFIKSTKRYYPNGDFASYIIGYTVVKNDEDDMQVVEGEMGVESYYNDLLTGEKGYSTYEKDKNGYKIPNGVEYTKDAVNGEDVYLTIDNNIELFVKNALDKLQTNSEAEWTLMVVADAKTGAILASSSTPSFNPNIKNITSYLNPLISYAYEPGSTMKIFSFLCAVNSGKYDGTTEYQSGTKDFFDQNDNTKVSTIRDWNKTGWGKITYDQGFAYSSNVAVANLLETTISMSDLKDCYDKYGFGKKTDIELYGELTGQVKFTYPIDAVAAGYGQGITTTPIQHIQALTAIANDGVMLKPYLVDKIVDTNTGKVTYKGERSIVDTIANSLSINKVKDLMKSVINPDSSVATGYPYYMEGYDIIGKTGSAQIYDYQQGKYLDGSMGTIYSFSGMFPYNDPKIILYAASSKQKDTVNYLSSSVKEVIVNVSKYLGLDATENASAITYEVPSFLNKNADMVMGELTSNGISVIKVGEGNKILNQYPAKDSIINNGDRVFLFTEGYQKKMINLLGYSYKEATSVLKIMNLNYRVDGSGYVTSQSILENTEISSEQELVLTLNPKYSP